MKKPKNIQENFHYRNGKTEIIGDTSSGYLVGAMYFDLIIKFLTRVVIPIILIVQNDNLICRGIEIIADLSK